MDQETISQNTDNSNTSFVKEPQSNTGLNPSGKSKLLKIAIIFALLTSAIGMGVFVGLRYSSNLAQQENMGAKNPTKNSLANPKSLTLAPVSTTTEPIIDRFSVYDDLNQFESTPNATFKVVKPEEVSSKIELTIFDTQNTNNSADALEAGPAPCQPDFFDPKTSKFYKVKGPGLPSELYAIQGYGQEEVGVMMIDGWDEEGSEKISLPAPYDVTVYRFGCESSESFVLDLYKDGKRQALYTHVSGYSFSKDGKRLFLLNSVNINGSWTFKKRIIDIETNTAMDVILPHAKDCPLNKFEWHGEKLTASCAYDLINQPPANFNSLIYIIDNKGAALAKIEANTATNIGIQDSYGLLPKDSNIFYLYTSSKAQEVNENLNLTCSLYILDITNKNNNIKYVDLINVKDAHPYVCTSEFVRLRLENLTYDGGSLLHAYRINTLGTNPEYTNWATVENK